MSSDKRQYYTALYKLKKNLGLKLKKLFISILCYIIPFGYNNKT